MGADDEVITVSHSFIATVNAVRYVGATPVFIDVEQTTGNLDSNLLRSAITDKTKAVIIAHQMGMPCDLVKIAEICDEFEIPIVEDAACAVGSEIFIQDDWENIGKPHGLIACFSFHPRKLLTCGDGGMLTTNDPSLAEKFRLLRQHGMTVSDLRRTESNEYIREQYVGLGFNYRLTDLQASVARIQLKRMPEVLARRQYLVELYAHNLESIDGIAFPEVPKYARSNWQTFCPTLSVEVDQTDVINALRERDIASRPGVMCSHQEPAFADMELKFSLPVSEMRRDQGLMLPLFHQMTEAEVDEVCGALSKILSRPSSRVK